MERYTISMNVTFDQELAIQSLFKHRGWTYQKLGINVMSKYISNIVEKCVQPHNNPSIQLDGSSTYSINQHPNTYQDLTLMRTGGSAGGSATIQSGSEEMTSSFMHTGTDSNLDPLSNTEFKDNASTQSTGSNICSQNVNTSPNDLSNSYPKMINLEHIPTTGITLHTDVSDTNSPPITTMPPKNQKQFDSQHEFPMESAIEKVHQLLTAALNLNLDEHWMKGEIYKILKYFTETLDKTSAVETSVYMEDTEIEDADNDCDTDLVTEIHLPTNQIQNVESSVYPSESEKSAPNIVSADTGSIQQSIDLKHTEPMEENTNENLKPKMEDTKKAALNIQDEYKSKLLSSKTNNRCKSKVGRKKTKRGKAKSGAKISIRGTTQFSWTVNRNLRMHKYHRKCQTMPTDLDSDMYSVSESGYYCADCQYIFVQKTKLILHKQLKSGHCLPECIYCDAEADKVVFHCDKCPKCFPNSAMLERHLAKHTQNLFCCHICDSTFYTIVDLKMHVQTSHSDTIPKEHLCDLCGSKFKEKKVLKAHVKYVHSENRPEQCNMCEKSFKTKSQLKNHLVTHKSVSELNLSCEICGMGFLRKATLKEHVRRHKKEYTNFCSVCGKGFYRPFDMEEHMRVHTGDKPFDCKYCGYKCALSCNLAKHMKIHKKQGLL